MSGIGKTAFSIIQSMKIVEPVLEMFHINIDKTIRLVKFDSSVGIVWTDLKEYAWLLKGLSSWRDIEIACCELVKAGRIDSQFIEKRITHDLRSLAVAFIFKGINWYLRDVCIRTHLRHVLPDNPSVYALERDSLVKIRRELSIEGVDANDLAFQIKSVPLKYKKTGSINGEVHRRTYTAIAKTGYCEIADRLKAYSKAEFDKITTAAHANDFSRVVFVNQVLYGMTGIHSKDSILSGRYTQLPLILE